MIVSFFFFWADRLYNLLLINIINIIIIFITLLAINIINNGASQVLLVVKNMPTNAGCLRDASLILDQEDPLEEGMATHSRILAWRIPWTEEPGGLWSIRLQKVGHN